MSWDSQGWKDSAVDYREQNPIPLSNGSTKQADIPVLEVLCLADVRLKRIDWLWNLWLAIGKVHVLAGVGGIGKSTTGMRLGGKNYKRRNLAGRC